MKRIIRLSAALLCAVLLANLAAVAGCGNSKKKEYVSADSPWYSLTQFEVLDQYRNDDTVDYYLPAFGGFSDGYLYYVTTGCRKMPDDMNYSNVDYSVLEFNIVDIYDLSGNLYRSIDLKDAIDVSPLVPSGQECTSLTIYDPGQIKIRDGKVSLILSGFLFPSWASNDYLMVYDLETETVESLEILFEDDDTDDNREYGCNGVYEFDGYSVMTYTKYYEDTSILLRVDTPDSEPVMYDMADILPDLVSPSVSEVIYLGEGKAMVDFFAGNWIDKYYYVMDLATGQMTEYTEDPSWFTNYFTSCTVTYFDDIGYVLTDNNGIKKIDFESGEVTDIFSYDSCNINRYETKNLSIVSFTDDQIIMSGAFERSNGSGSFSFDFEVYILERQETNPNAGKKILSAATLTEFDHTFCEAVRDFNDTNADYFIEFDSSYSLRQMYLTGQIDTYTDGYDAEGLQAQTTLSNQLAIDLMSGDGPDIVADGASLYQLNRDDYLVDLASELDLSGLFGNAIEASKVDGKLYQLPLTISLTGIVARNTEVEDGQCGFTFEQYDEFVHDRCNGEDPLALAKADYFVTCLSAMNDECISGNTVSYSGDSVRELASYVNESVIEPDTIEDEFINIYETGRGIKWGEYMENISFATILDSATCGYFRDVRVMGLPSSDGRGPMLAVGASVAVSSKTEDREACLDFVRLLLSDDIQTEYGSTGQASPIRISAFEASAQIMLDDVNSQIRQWVQLVETYGIHDQSMTEEEIDPSLIQEYEDMIATCSHVASLDPAIMVIVKEEMPAYFSGQKTLDEVIALMENRVQTFMDERG